MAIPQAGRSIWFWKSKQGVNVRTVGLGEGGSSGTGPFLNPATEKEFHNLLQAPCGFQIVHLHKTEQFAAENGVGGACSNPKKRNPQEKPCPELLRQYWNQATQSKERQGMKSLTTTSAGWRLGLATSMITLLGGFAANAGSGLIANETFDPPTTELGGWEGNVLNISRQYVSEGVGGSTAAQISAELLGGDAYIGTVVYQNALIIGYDCATPQNTVLSFDVKVDRPDVESLVVGLGSVGGIWWNWFTPDLPVTGSRGVIPLGAYLPGEFKTIVVAVDDPLWIVDPFSTEPLDGLFDPSGKTYQIWFQVDSGGLPNGGQFTVTIDNVKIATKSPLVPFKAAGAGQLIPGQDAGFAVKEAGVATHLGSYTETIAFPGEGPGVVEIKAANGDMLLGSAFVLSYTEVAVVIEGGTGRFKGAKGSYIVTLTWIDEIYTAYTATAAGNISTVGFNKK